MVNLHRALLLKSQDIVKKVKIRPVCSYLDFALKGYRGKGSSRYGPKHPAKFKRESAACVKRPWKLTTDDEEMHHR